MENVLVDREIVWHFTLKVCDSMLALVSQLELLCLFHLLLLSPRLFRLGALSILLFFHHYSLDWSVFLWLLTLHGSP